MSAEKLLKEALEETGWLVKRVLYRPADGKKRAERYIVFNLAHEGASGFADDMPMGETSYWQIHIFLPETQNPAAIKKEVKGLLMDRGFSYPETVLDTLEGNDISEAGMDGREKSSRKRHICLETNITQEL